MIPPLRGKQLAALRAIAATPGGLRITAYPSAMPLLVQMGLVEERGANQVILRAPSSVPNYTEMKGDLGVRAGQS